MKTYTENEIQKLQDSLASIRKAGGWTTEEFGDMIGVTKQTISNLENQKTPMSKIQYIAIRAVLEYEASIRPDDYAFVSAINVGLNGDNLSEVQKQQARAFLEGATKTGLDKKTIISGLSALVGVAAVESILAPVAGPVVVAATAGSWFAKMVRDRKHSNK